MKRREQMLLRRLSGIANRSLVIRKVWGKTLRPGLGDKTIFPRGLNSIIRQFRIAPIMILMLITAVGLAGIPLKASAQIVLPIGLITPVAATEPAMWAMSGMEMVNVTQTIGGESPISRTLKWDARTVEILSRTQNPPPMCKRY